MAVSAVGIGQPGALEAHAGRWIAQDGADVVVVGDTPQEVIAALTQAGRTGAIWRVPRSKAEAEAVIGTSP